MSKEKTPTRQRRTVKRAMPTGPKKGAKKAARKSTTKKQGPTDASEAVDQVAGNLVESVKESLEYELANREVYITVQGKRLTFRAWGLAKELQYGGRIVSLVQRLQGIVSPESFDPENLDFTLLSHLFSLIAEDVLDIIAGSITDPFNNHGDAYDWIDQECDFQDLFNMAVIVYDQNFKGEKGLGKRLEGFQTAVEGITKLVTEAVNDK